MSDALAKLYAAKFISRPDVKAIQRSDGSYNPVRSPFTKLDLVNHISGTKTYGHYTVGQDDTTKLFAFDIDFEVEGQIPTYEWKPEEEPVMVPGRPRDEWRKRSSPLRPFMKYGLRYISQTLARAAFDVLELPVAIAYSGCKGLHVYCFLPKGTSAHDAREGARLCLKEAGQGGGGFEQSRGNNFFKHTDPEFQMLSVEVFPKQDSMADKDLGNLMRLPLGRNLKSKDPTFFVDCHAPMNQLVPAGDPLALLESGNPWA